MNHKNKDHIPKALWSQLSTSQRKAIKKCRKNALKVAQGFLVDNERQLTHE